MSIRRSMVQRAAWQVMGVAAGLALTVSWAGAAGGGGGGGSELGSTGVSPEFTQAVAEIQAEHWPQAIGLLEHYLTRARNDADGHNWLAYAYRKSGQLEPAFAHYKRALAINPTHLGAHEYLGEAYLMAGKPDQAEYHLRELARICAASCEEYTDLKVAIAQYRGRPAGAVSAR